MAHLDRFGIFDMDRAGVRLAPVRGGDEDEVELLLALRERGRLFLKAGTEVGGGEGGGNVTARIRNALGGGEAVEMNASIGTKTKSAYQVSRAACGKQYTYTLDCSKVSVPSRSTRRAWSDDSPYWLTDDPLRHPSPLRCSARRCYPLRSADSHLTGTTRRLRRITRTPRVRVPS